VDRQLATADVLLGNNSIAVSDLLRPVPVQQGNREKHTRKEITGPDSLSCLGLGFGPRGGKRSINAAGWLLRSIRPFHAKGVPV